MLANHMLQISIYYYLHYGSKLYDNIIDEMEKLNREVFKSLALEILVGKFV